MDADLSIWIAGAFMLFIIGLYGMISKRDTLRLIISIELMVIAGNMLFIGFGYLRGNFPLMESYAILSLGIGGSIIGLAIAFMGKIYASHKSVDVRNYKELKW